jgi:hypothetical protein
MNAPVQKSLNELLFFNNTAIGSEYLWENVGIERLRANTFNNDSFTESVEIPHLMRQELLPNQYADAWKAIITFAFKKIYMNIIFFVFK